MSAFASNDAYSRFARTVRSTARYVRGAESEGFLAAVLAQAESKVEIVPQARVLWRAQLGHEWETVHDDDFEHEVPMGYGTSRMKPLRDRAKEGRANPKGIPVIYLATLPETAMAEVRPWVGSGVSLGQFETKRDLRLVNCTEHAEYRWHWGYETPEEYWDDNNWCDIDTAFSTPLTGTDDVAEYVPTQVVAELFRVNGFDGVAYESSVGDGHNVALFDLDAVQMTACAVYSLKSVKFDFNQEWNPYFLKRADDLPSADSDG